MSIVILNRFPSYLGRYQAWLRDYPGTVHFFCNKKTAHEYPEVEQMRVYRDFTNNPLVELDLIELAKTERIEAIIALDEGDILRAARMRAFLGLPGQDLTSAVAYRDKVVMKEHLRAQGVRVPAFTRVHGPLELVTFAQTHGYPVVVKPADAFGAIGVDVLRSEQEMTRYLSALPLDRYRNLEVEAFIDGAMHNVDGIMHNGQVLFHSVGVYLKGCLNYKQDGGYAYRLISREDPLFSRLGDFIRDVVAALPDTPYTGFHGEVFVTATGEIILCEIAARTGGARLDEALRLAYGVDLNGLKVRYEAGLDVPWSFDLPMQTQVGGTFTHARHGTLTQLPDSVPFEWVKEYLPLAQTGQRFQGATFGMDFIASALVVGDTPTEVESRLHQVDSWLHDHIVWDEQLEPAVAP